jgi:hypothetical protein
MRIKSIYFQVINFAIGLVAFLYGSKAVSCTASSLFPFVVHKVCCGFDIVTILVICCIGRLTMEDRLIPTLLHVCPAATRLSAEDFFADFGSTSFASWRRTPSSSSTQRFWSAGFRRTAALGSLCATLAINRSFHKIYCRGPDTSFKCSYPQHRLACQCCTQKRNTTRLKRGGGLVGQTGFHTSQHSFDIPTNSGSYYMTFRDH